LNAREEVGAGQFRPGQRGETVRYRINRNGRRVVECDPACIQSIYSFDALRILNEGENDHER